MPKRTFGHLVKLAMINAQTGLDHDGNKFSKGSDDLSSDVLDFSGVKNLRIDILHYYTNFWFTYEYPYIQCTFLLRWI